MKIIPSSYGSKNESDLKGLYAETWFLVAISLSVIFTVTILIIACALMGIGRFGRYPGKYHLEVGFLDLEGGCCICFLFIGYSSSH